MKRSLLASIVVVMLAAGCNKQEAPAPAPRVTPPPPAATAAPGTTPDAPPPASQPAVPANATEMAASNLLTFNFILKEWVAKNRRVPKDFEELVAAKAFRVVPQPPPGKRFAIDPQKVELILVDR